MRFRIEVKVEFRIICVNVDFWILVRFIEFEFLREGFGVLYFNKFFEWFLGFLMFEYS